MTPWYSAPWPQPRPYSETRGAPPPGTYWRPNLHLQWLWLAPEVRAAALWSVAWSATTILCGIRIWQAITATDDNEIGD